MVDSSASNHVTGAENGSGSSWWTYTAGDGSGSSSSSSWSASWSYDETVAYPGFYDGAYYGGGEEEYFAYLGDAFRDYPGYDSGFFVFAYSREQPLSSDGDQPLAQGQTGAGQPLPCGQMASTQQGALLAADSQVTGGDEGTLAEEESRVFTITIYYFDCSLYLR